MKLLQTLFSIYFNKTEGQLFLNKEWKIYAFVCEKRKRTSACDIHNQRDTGKSLSCRLIQSLLKNEKRPKRQFLERNGMDRKVVCFLDEDRLVLLSMLHEDHLESGILNCPLETPPRRVSCGWFHTRCPPSPPGAASKNRYPSHLSCEDDMVEGVHS
ncbi:hypothetical protein MAR_005503 [Mya arenaria]|uniref:Uncharacterized protein n=1 Tax=Mya arenaria TaxID=6604 RepID=A0ABY7F3W3_MYAAR|nr:hypothetical protein MAR_005503 [Mya arenaria]